MERAFAMDDRGKSSSEDLRRALVQGDAMLGGIGPILGHLLSAPDHSLFSDEIVARVRGMLADLARQVLRTQAEATGQRGRDAFADRHGVALAEHFQASSGLMLHCHAIAIEWQLTEKLEDQLNVDPVLSPLLQRLIADSDGTVSSAAMAALAAQARFAQAQRRMELPLGELPGDLLHELLLAWRRYCGETRSDAVARAESRLRQSYDESSGRLALFSRLVSNVESTARNGLAIEDAGAALFLSALAHQSGQTREMAILSTHARQTVRLALGLRAAGMEAAQIDETLLRLHPAVAPVTGLENIDRDTARGILLASAYQVGR